MAVSVVDKVVGNLLPFAWGDGSTVAFKLGLASPISSSPILYKSDWQGNQKLYSTERTNLLLQSQTFDHASWAKTALTVGANATTAPDGTLTADKVKEDAASNSRYIDQQPVSPASSEHTVIWHLKAGERSVVQIFSYSAPAYSVSTVFTLDLLTGVVSAPNAVGGAVQSIVVIALPDGWFRVEHTLTLGGAGTGILARVRLGNSVYQGDNASGFYIWGADMKLGGASSYIPTVAAPVAVTDYALSGNTVTLASAPAAGVPLLYKQFDEHGLKL